MITVFSKQWFKKYSKWITRVASGSKDKYKKITNYWLEIIVYSIMVAGLVLKLQNKI